MALKDDLSGEALKREFLAGVTTFLTLSYIVVVNPAILSSEGTGMPFQGVLTATVVLSFLCTLLMGLYARLPYAVAPGMGINAFFTYSLILGEKIPWPTALGMVFWSGVIFILLSVTPVRVAIVRAMPKSIRHGAAVGIGLFLTFIGLKNAGIVESHPATLVTMGKITVETGLFGLGLIVILWLMRFKKTGAFLFGIVLITVLAALLGKTQPPTSFVSLPDFESVFFKLDLWGSLKLSLLPAIISLMFTDLFDSLSTFMGLSQAANLLDEHGEPLNIKEGLTVDALATALAGVFGTSSGTAYIESAAGVEAGGRTGWTAVFAALCFLPCLFIGPTVGMVPAAATAPVLVIVGLLMFQSVREIPFGKLEEAFPAFLTVILIPLTFSITQGLLWGLLSHVALYLVVGRGKEIPKMLYAIAVLCGVLLFIQNH